MFPDNLPPAASGHAYVPLVPLGHSRKVHTLSYTLGLDLVNAHTPSFNMYV